MLKEIKVTIVRCDLGDCDLTQKLESSLEITAATLLFKAGWTTLNSGGQLRYICSHCYESQLRDVNECIGIEVDGEA